MQLFKAPTSTPMGYCTNMDAKEVVVIAVGTDLHSRGFLQGILANLTDIFQIDPTSHGWKHKRLQIGTIIETAWTNLVSIGQVHLIEQTVQTNTARSKHLQQQFKIKDTQNNTTKTILNRHICNNKIVLH